MVRRWTDPSAEGVISQLETQSPSTLEIAVAVGPDAKSPGTSLPRELAMVKASLLYADKVTLASVPVALHLYFHLAATGDFLERAVLIHRMLQDPPPPPDEASARLVVELRSQLSEFLALQNKLAWSTDGQEFLRSERLKMSLSTLFERLEGALEEPLASHYAEFDAPVREGVLRISDLGVRHAPHSPFPVEDIITQYYRRFIVDYALSPSGAALPMFDGPTWQWVQAVSTQPSAESAVTRDAREAALAYRLLGGLPSIPGASMDVVLEVREEIADSRAQFRAAVSAAAAELHSAPGDPDFERDFERVQRAIVGPAIGQVEAQIGDRKVAAILGRLATARNVLPAGVAFGVALASGLDQVMATTISAGVVGVNALTAELRHQRASHNAERHNGFYMLYDTQRRIQRGTRRRRRSG